MKLAVQLYSLRDYLTSEDKVFEMAKILHEMGVKYVQLSGFGKLNDENESWFETAFHAHDIQVVATHIDYHQLKHEFDRVLNFHKRLNIPYVGLGALPQQFERDKVNDYQTFVFEFNNIAQNCQKHGLNLLYHNHSFEFVHHGPFLPFDIIMQNMNTDVIQLLPDLYWLQVAGVNPITFIEEYHRFFNVVHIKDMRLELDGPWTTKPRFAAVGDGNMGYASILRSLVEHNIEYAIIEQDDFYGKDPFNEIQRSIQYTTNVLKTIL